MCQMRANNNYFYFKKKLMQNRGSFCQSTHLWQAVKSFFVIFINIILVCFIFVWQKVHFQPWWQVLFLLWQKWIISFLFTIEILKYFSHLSLIAIICESMTKINVFLLFWLYLPSCTWMLAAVQKLNELLSFIMLLTNNRFVVIFMCDYVLVNLCFSV